MDQASPPADAASIAPLAIRPRLLGDLLDRAVAEHPDWTAVDFFGRCWTYRALGKACAGRRAGCRIAG